MNTLLKSLLKDNKRVLQSLHACIGLDFKKPYYIFDIEGKFTINQLIKAAAGAGYIPKKDIFVIFTRTETGFYTNYRVAVLDSSGNMEKDINSTGYNNNKFVSLDTFYTKSDFETVRKSAAHTIVICQNRDFLSIPARKNIDSMQRLKLLKAQVNTPYNRTEKCIYSLNMQTTDNNGLNYQLDTYRYNTMDINTLIDKSGYLLIYRRETLRRRAAILRAEIDKIQKYVKRYNLDIFHRSNIRFNYVSNNYDVFLAIRTPENKLESENYYYYLNECKNAIDNLIHEYYEKGIYHTKHKELNVKLRGIMDYYGEQYNDYLFKKAI